MTSRADRATSSTTLAANPAGIQGASSPPLTSIHQSPKTRQWPLQMRPTDILRLKAFEPRGARLWITSPELCPCDRALLGKKSLAELLPNWVLSGNYSNISSTEECTYWPERPSGRPSVPSNRDTHNSQLFTIVLSIYDCCHLETRVSKGTKWTKSLQQNSARNRRHIRNWKSDCSAFCPGWRKHRCRRQE